MPNLTLAKAINFMIFGLGGVSVPAEPGLARPYTAHEVHLLRARPLKARQLARLRDEALAKADPACLARAPSEATAAR